MYENEILREAIKLIRLQRHDALNHIQVVMGYLQLNNKIEAKKHLKAAVNELQKNTSILRIECPQLAITLLSLTDEAFRMEIPINIQCKSNLSILKDDEDILTKLVNFVWRTCLAYELRLHKDERYINIIIDENDNIIFSTANLLNCLSEEQICEFNYLVKQINYKVVLMDEKLIIKKV